MNIRPVRITDAPHLAKLITAAWRWAYEGIIPEGELAQVHTTFTANSFEERIGNAKGLYLVATDDMDNAIGFASENTPPFLHEYKAEIGGLYVSPDSTRNGVGKALVKAMVAEFAVRGDESLCIHTLKANRIGRAFYEKIGGKQVAEDKWREFPAIWYGWDDLSSLQID